MVHYCRHNSEVPLRHTLLKLGRSAALPGEGGTVHVASHRAAEWQVHTACIWLFVKMIILVSVNKFRLVVVSRGNKITATCRVISQKSAILMRVFCAQV
jgi:hypothetical protein